MYISEGWTWCPCQDMIPPQYCTCKLWFHNQAVRGWTSAILLNNVTTDSIIQPLCISVLIFQALNNTFFLLELLWRLDKMKRRLCKVFIVKFWLIDQTRQQRQLRDHLSQIFVLSNTLGYGNLVDRDSNKNISRSQVCINLWSKRKIKYFTLEAKRGLTVFQAEMQVMGKGDDNPEPRSGCLKMEEVNDLFPLNCPSLP